MIYRNANPSFVASEQDLRTTKISEPQPAQESPIYTPLTSERINERTTLNAGWSHIEWGAANYGETRQRESDRFTPSPVQHKLLLEFLDNYVTRHGKVGTLFLNDLEENATSAVAKVVREHCKNLGYKIEVIEYPGDYCKVEIPKTCTSRIANPQSSFFREDRILHRLSSQSATGLEVITHYGTKIDELVQKYEDLHSLCVGSASRYVFPSGRQVQEDHLLKSRSRRWIFGEDRLAVLSGAISADTYTLGTGRVVYSWVTERRLTRLLGTESSRPYTPELQDKLRARSVATLGPGYYGSLDPFQSSGYGKHLLALEPTRNHSFITIPPESLKDFNRYARALGYRAGINDSDFQEDLRSAGYTGIFSSGKASGYGITQFMILKGADDFVLHNGSDYLTVLSPPSILESPLAQQITLSLKKLRIQDQLDAIITAAESLGIQRSALLTDSRTLGQKIRPWVEQIGRNVLGHVWTKLSTKCYHLIASLTDAKLHETINEDTSEKQHI